LDFAKFLESLKHLPLTLLAAMSAAGLFILFGPHLPGLDAARKWGWLAPATLLATILLVLRCAEVLLESYFRVTAHNPQRTLSLTVHSQINTTWWGDGTMANGPLTQMVANISAYNPSDRPVRIAAARLIKPSVPAPEVRPIIFMVSNDLTHGGSRQNAVPPSENASIHLTIMVARKLGGEGKFIHTVIGLTDQNGYEHKVKVKLWPMPKPQPPQDRATSAATM
jgi:hypothetical protein